MPNEISSIPEEIHDLDEGFDYSISNGEETDIDTYVDTLFTMLSDSDELPEEMQDSASTYLKETNSNNNEDLSKSEKSQSVQSKDDDFIETQNKAFSKEQKDTVVKDHSELKENSSSQHDHLFKNSREFSPVDDEFAFSHSKQNETYDEKNHDEKENNINSKIKPSQQNNDIYTQEKEEKDSFKDKPPLIHKKTFSKRK